jgi:hypothetical protein
MPPKTWSEKEEKAFNECFAKATTASDFRRLMILRGIKKTPDALESRYKRAKRAHVTAATPTICIGLTEKDLRAKHDTMFKIRAGVKALKKGIYFMDQQMREHCKVASNAWRGYSEQAEFESYKTKLNGILYWGTVESIKKLEDISNG